MSYQLHLTSSNVLIEKESFAVWVVSLHEAFFSLPSKIQTKLRTERQGSCSGTDDIATSLVTFFIGRSSLSHEWSCSHVRPKWAGKYLLVKIASWCSNGRRIKIVIQISCFLDLRDVTLRWFFVSLSVSVSRGLFDKTCIFALMDITQDCRKYGHVLVFLFYW